MDSNVVFGHKVIKGFAPVLTYAACEWFLIFLMFIDALLSYLLVWFARYCRLQMPCFLCSKLLHPLHWRFLLCKNHRLEVSSFMSCHNHNNNLADCRGMCDDCLLSFTKMTSPSPDMNRLLLGKLGYDLLSKNHFAHPRSCSCCNKPWRTRHRIQRVIRLGSRGRPNIPTPRNLSRRGSSGSLKKMRGHKATSVAEYVDLGSQSDALTHGDYSQLKIHSDSESDFLFSDDDAFLPMTDYTVQPSEESVHKWKSFEDEKKLHHKKPDLRDNQDNETVKLSMPRHSIVNRTQQPQRLKTEYDDVLSELITMSEARPFSLGSPRKDAAKPAQSVYEAQVRGNSYPSSEEFLSPSAENSASREIQIQPHDDSTSYARNIPSTGKKRETSDAAKEQNMFDHFDMSGSVAIEPSSDEEKEFDGDSKPVTTNIMSDSLEKEQWSEEEKKVTESNVGEEYFSNDEEYEVSGHSDPLTSKIVSGSLAEEKSSEEDDGSNGYLAARDKSSNHEDVYNEESKPLTSNNTTGYATEEHSDKYEHGDYREAEALTSPKIPNAESSLEHSNKEHSDKDEHGDYREAEALTSPKIPNAESSLEHSNKDSSKVTETHNTSKGSPELKHSASVEFFVSISSDIEGESLVDQLKQQLAHDRKCLKDLSKELEEERNASAIATNEAMAMITRLQEEKAALHMEALQYLRMMDEQAEHDVDALERANDVLADREKEIQDLEMELEYYRTKYPDEPREEILASMGILENIGETNGISRTDEPTNKASADTKHTGSLSAEN